METTCDSSEEEKGFENEGTVEFSNEDDIDMIIVEEELKQETT